MKAIIELNNITPDILDKIKDYLMNLKSVESSIKMVQDPFDITEKDLYHIERSLEDLENGRIIPASDVIKNMRKLCQEK